VKLVVDAGRCTGHGRCYSLAPALFDADEHGHCVLLRDDVPPEQERAAKLAAANCPEDAIELSE
jgi:ferredoxin